MTRRHHYHSPWRRGTYSLALIGTLMALGTVGMHRLESMTYLDAFYFMSMLATAQGPSLVPQTPAGKLFAACMAFISVGAVVTSLGFVFGPFLGQLWKIGVEKLEEEAKALAERDHKSKRS